MRRNYVLACGFASITFISALCIAQTTAPKWSDLDQAIGKEDYKTAFQVANTILQRGTADDRKKVSAVYARVLLALGQKEQARKYLNQMAKPGNDVTGGQQTKIYKAWLLALDGKSDEAIKSLEKMLESNPHSDTTAEAADVLAVIYMANGDTEKAKKAVDFGLQVLQYKGVKDGYALALLRGRLTSNFTAGWAKRMYDEAERLRVEKKFAEAGQLFAQVRAMYPKSEWAHASGFRIGQCFLSAGNFSQAVDHWQKFIKEFPAGPWRGQAHVAMVDAVLQAELNMKKAAEHATAATETLKTLDKPAEEKKEKQTTHRREASKNTVSSSNSWKDTAYDIYLRQGIVSLVAGRYDVAEQAFQQAQKVSPNPLLDRLIEASKKRMRLYPAELAIGDDRAAVAIALGTVYKVLRQYDLARGYFTLPLNGSMRSRSAPHRSFAGLGFARILVATGGGPTSQATITISPKKGAKPVAPPAPVSPLMPAVVAYNTSLKEYPGGSWHDETLRELALLTERIAVETTTPAKKAPEEKGKPVVTESVRQQQKKALIAARLKALPTWNDLRQRYPSSRHVSEALYHAGVLFTDAEKPDEALAAFEELANKYPTSPWTGEAQVRLIDVKLERQFDLPAARTLAEAATAWYEHLDHAKAAEAKNNLVDDQSDTLRSLKEVGYDIYVRAGLVEYLSQGDQDKEKSEVKDPRLAAPNDRSSSTAIAFFEKAKLLSPERNMIVVHGTIPTGIERLIEVAKAGKSLTPDAVRAGNEKARLILMLADAYHAGEEWHQSLDLCNRIISGAVPKATREQKSYAHFKRARNYFSFDGDEFKPEESLKDYVVAVRSAPKAEWASKAMLLAANIL